jgi:hypothetical protein
MTAFRGRAACCGPLGGVALLALLAGIGANPRSAWAEGADLRRIVLWDPSVELVGGARQRLGSVGLLVEPERVAEGRSPAEQQAVADSSALLERAQACYYEARFDEAASLLEEHLATSGATLAASGGSDALRAAALWLGASLAKLGRSDDAVSWLVLAVGLGQAEIDTAVFPPEVTAAFDRAREVAARPGAAAALASEPAGARFEVDGSAVERAPLLAPGRHVVVARRTGFAPAAELVVAGDAPLALVVRLERGDRAEAARQVAALRREGAFAADDPSHRALLALSAGADLVAIVDPGDGEVRLFDATGAAASWPDEPEPPGASTSTGASADRAVEPSRAPRPVWRTWWFWVAIVGSAAAVATGVGLGVHYGASGSDTFTIVPAAPGRGAP